MRLHLPILTAIAIFVSFLLLAFPSWASLDLSVSSANTLSDQHGYPIDRISASLAVTITETPLIPQTMNPMPTSTPTTTLVNNIYVPALVDSEKFVKAAVEPCGPNERPSPTIDAEATSTPAPTVTPIAVETLPSTFSITATPEITTTFINSTTVCPPNVYEAALATLLINSPLQQRDSLTYNPILAQVARDHAIDMGVRDYFGSVDPSGIGPNYRVHQAGYRLPSNYGNSLSANNIETIVGGFATPEEAWNALSMNSGNIHAVGDHQGYSDQTEYGVGYAYIADSTYRRYWVILIAKPNDER